MSTEVVETIVSTAGEKLTPAQGAANIASTKNGAPKAPSAASKKAAKTQGDKPATQPKATAPKPAPKPESTEPSPNEVKRIVGDALIDAAAAMVRTWDPAKHNGVTVLQASELAGSYCSFTPGSHWAIELDEPRYRARPQARAGRRRAQAPRRLHQAAHARQARSPQGSVTAGAGAAGAVPAPLSAYVPAEDASAEWREVHHA